MHYLAYSGLAIFLTSVFSALFVYINGPKREINITWGLFALFVALWGMGLFFGFRTADEYAALFWTRFLNIVAVFVPLFFLHFVYAFTNKSRQNIQFMLFSYIFVLSYFILILLYPDMFIQNVVKQPRFDYYPQAGSLFFVFLLFYLSNVIIGGFELWNYYKQSIGSRKNQTKYLFWGIVIGFAGGATTFPLVFGINIFPFGTWLVVLYVLLTTYAILKHHLMDIEIIIKKTAIYSILTAILTGLFVSITMFIQYFFAGLTGLTSFWVAILAAFVVAFVFQPLRDRIQSIVDKLFFKSKYNYRDTLKDLSQTAVSIIEMDKLLKLACKNVKSTLKTEIVSVYLLEKDGHYIRK